jgi:hypothetical protein
MAGEQGSGGFLADLWQAITDAFSQRPPPGPVQMCLMPVFEAHIVGVRFLSPIVVARRGSAITGEHWTEGVDVNEPLISDGSRKAAVVLIAGRGDPRVRLRIRVTRSIAVGPTGPVSGSFDTLRIVGTTQCPTSVGEHTLDARIDVLHLGIRRDAGDASWSMTVDPIGTAALGSTRLELVTILDTPPAFYAGGVWIEVLRMLVDQAGVAGLDRKRESAAAVTRFTHFSLALNLNYDTEGGRPHFNSGTHGANGFLLAKLISPIRDKIVNCFDTAAAVTALTGALGIALGWKFMQPFGFLAPTRLIGVGQCNNPFFRGVAFVRPRPAPPEPAFPHPMAPPDHTHRTWFGNHAFTRFATAANADLGGPDRGVAEGIGDACAGPVLFAGTLTDYVLNAVDQQRPVDPARQTAMMQLAAIDAWERGQIAMAQSLLGLTDEQKQQMIANIRALAEQARQNTRAMLAASEMAAVVDGVGVNSLQFRDYSGP